MDIRKQSRWGRKRAGSDFTSEENSYGFDVGADESAVRVVRGSDRESEVDFPRVGKESKVGKGHHKGEVQFWML